MLWLPVLWYRLLGGAHVTAFWTLISVVLAFYFSKNSVGVLNDFVAQLDSKALLPLEINIRRSFLYGPLIRRFKILRRQMTQEIVKTKNEQELLNKVLEAISDGVVAVSVDRNIIFCNPMARLLCDIKKEHVYQRPIEEIIPVPRVHEISRSDEFFRKPMQEHFSVFHQQEEKRLIMQTEPFGINQVEGTVITIKDLSEHYRQEKMKQEFIANASHDLKTPLMVIRGCLDTLSDDSLSPHLREEFIEKASRNIDSLSKLTQNLLQMSKSELQSDGFNKTQVVEISNVIHGVCENFRSIVESKGLKFYVEADTDIFVLGDDQSFRVIFENLLDNALKYTKDGHIKVLVRQNDSHALIDFIDTGGGISKKDMPRIFDGFYRSDQARTTQGFGLGLSIVKRLVNKMNGNIEIESHLGKGTVVKMQFTRQLK